MFGDIGWAEMLLIGIVALVVIGPQDLPDLFRQIGRFTAKLRQMGREFQRAMEEAAKESGVKDVAKGLNAVSNPARAGMSAVKEAADRFEKWDPIKNAAKPSKPVTSGTISGPTPPTGTIAAPPTPPRPAEDYAATKAALKAEPEPEPEDEAEADLVDALLTPAEPAAKAPEPPAKPAAEPVPEAAAPAPKARKPRKPAAAAEPAAEAKPARKPRAKKADQNKADPA